MISSVVTPLRASFYDEDDILWLVIECGTDLVFAADIFLTFFSAYYNGIEELVSSRRDIACSYVRSWFWLDVVSVIPLSLFLKSTVNGLGKLARLPRVA